MDNRSIFLPNAVESSYFDQFASQSKTLANFETRTALSDKIYKLLRLQNENDQHSELENLHSNTEHQIYLSKLIRQAKIDPQNLPRD